MQLFFSINAALSIEAFTWVSDKLPERYPIPVIYPLSLSREMFITMDIVVNVVNVVVYAKLLFKIKKAAKMKVLETNIYMK